MGRRLFTILMAVSLILGSTTASFGASGKNVAVTLPNFSITVNGVKLDNTYSKYPFIVYNNVTYFPMTYGGCRFLGLENNWKGNAEGLSVDATGITAAYRPYQSSSKNGGSYQASAAAFPIKVNGKAIDNGKQQYPLLSFRNITYFPMTWDFAVKEFGWKYSFNAKDGLVISLDNIKLEQKTIVGTIMKEPYENISGSLDKVAVTDRFVYYANSSGRIIQASLADMSKIKTVYELPKWSYGDGEYVHPGLSVENGIAYLKYHQGGAVMGSDFVIRLNDDGTTTELQSSYTRHKSFGDKEFAYFTGAAPGPGNLLMKTGTEEYKNIGDPDYIYGWTWKKDKDGSEGGGGTDDVYLSGDELYILAFNMVTKEPTTTGIYRVNINTNETVRIADEEVMGFRADGDYLYYQIKGTFFRYSLKDGKKETIKQVTTEENGIQDYLVLNGWIYWEKSAAGGRYSADGEELNAGLYDINGKNLNEGAMLSGMKLAGVGNDYLVCTFKETSTSKYRIMVFDRDGNVVFKTSDNAGGSINIVSSKIYFYNATTGTVCVGQLR